MKTSDGAWKGEQKRLMVLNEVEKGEMVGREAAEVSGGSERNRCRILASYRGDLRGYMGSGEESRFILSEKRFGKGCEVHPGGSTERSPWFPGTVLSALFARTQLRIILEVF